MRRATAFLVPLAFLFILFACKKSGGGGGNSSQDIRGNWAFLGMNNQTQTTSNQAGGIKVVAYSNYYTKNNTGSINFNGDSMRVTGLGFSVDTTLKAYFYFANLLFDSSLQPLKFSIPPTSASAKYTAVGTDSLYFPGGGILSTLVPSIKGSGGHYVIKGDSLTLTTQGTDTTGGALTLLKATIRMKRQ